jgi:hypothetical protein
MPNPYNKYRTNKGHKRIVKIKKEKYTTPEGYFDPDAQENWLFKDDPKPKKYNKLDKDIKKS